MYKFIAGCIIGFVLSLLTILLGAASTIGARRWKP